MNRKLSKKQMKMIFQHARRITKSRLKKTQLEVFFADRLQDKGLIFTYFESISKIV